MNKEMLQAMFGLEEIQRYHMVQCKQPQSVASHSLRVGVIASHLAGEVGKCPMTAMYWGCFHDADEFITGDIPTHVKIALRRKNIHVADLSKLPLVPPEYKWIVKSADYMESLIWLGKNYQSKRSMDVFQYISGQWGTFLASMPVDDAAAARKVFEMLKKLDKDQPDYDLRWPEELRDYAGE